MTTPRSTHGGHETSDAHQGCAVMGCELRDDEASGPWPVTANVSHCDRGEHRMKKGEQWWLVADSTKGWENGFGATCAAHRSAPVPHHNHDAIGTYSGCPACRTNWLED
jgi:hypothetical protein